ncbi:serine carboxypeptidase domain-containing protein [Phthorimaea operculella]|nr:serine carboxypeptidase domain-containing protein [Phthorimaea operculella]
MVLKSVICVLVLSVVSTRGRVAFPDVSDITTNLIKEDEIKKVLEIHIDLPTIKPEDFTTTESNSNIVESKDIKENTIESRDNNKNKPDSSENEVLPKEDSGVALKLTQYIKDKNLDEARSASKVDKDMFLGVESYTGFFTVNETYDSNLFFWYFPAEDKPVNETPWIIWLQGGPGASSMTGLFDEIGPFKVTPDHQLVRNTYSWLQNHSLVFIDNPVGTGFSYTASKDGYVTDMDTYGAHLYSALQQFLQVFPELRAAPLYIAGESYAGKYVPSLAIHIHRNKAEEDINLQGLITGNAYVDPPMIAEMERPFKNVGLLEPEQIATLQPLIDAFKRDIENNDSEKAKTRWNNLITILLVMTHQAHAYNFLRDELGLGYYISFLNKPEVKKAIHAGGIEFNFVNMTVNRKLNGDFLSSAKPLNEELLEHYKLLTYCGQLDLMLSCVLTSENYRTWHWSGSDEFLRAVRHPYMYNKKVAGYHKSGGHLTEVVIRGAGHMAPMDAPGPLQRLIAKWTHGEALGTVPLLTGNFTQEFIQNTTRVFDTLNYL